MPAINMARLKIRNRIRQTVSVYYRYFTDKVCDYFDGYVGWGCWGNAAGVELGAEVGEEEEGAIFIFGAWRVIWAFGIWGELGLVVWGLSVDFLLMIASFELFYNQLYCELIIASASA